MTKPVAILGCGPAGLLAAHAAEQQGYTPVIFSIKQKSVITGAQFLHEAIPGLSRPDDYMSIEFDKAGTQQGYAQKVYGAPDAPCSWAEYPAGAHPAYALAPAYDRLWDYYSPGIRDGAISEVKLIGIESMFDHVVSTIPVPAICERNDEHLFYSKQVWIRASDDLDLRARRKPDFIEYNGDPAVPYYRMSKIGRLWSFEFGHEVNHSVPGLKPLRTDCDCRPKVVRLGRFGQWKKGVLLHHAYHGMGQYLDAL